MGDGRSSGAHNTNFNHTRATQGRAQTCTRSREENTHTVAALEARGGPVDIVSGARVARMKGIVKGARMHTKTDPELEPQVTRVPETCAESVA